MHLAFDGAVRREEKDLGQLLGDCRTALNKPPGHDIGNHRTRKADGIDAEMLIEPAILDGDDGFRQIW